MNYRLILRFLSGVLAIEVLLMLPALGISLYTHDRQAAMGFVVTMLICAALILPGWFLTKKSPKGFYTREGMLTTGLVWIAMSLIGALPFYFSGRIPGYIDCLFEIVSGFSTTGASVVTDVESLGKGLLFWRSFSHWIGGMGVLVFFMAIMPARGQGNNNGYMLHLLRAESPGPSVDKTRPRMRDTAVTLYKTYLILTVADIICLLLARMPVFDAVCIAFGTAGTGGFAVLNSGCADYSMVVQGITTIFMLLFGINFGVLGLAAARKFDVLRRDEELRCYLGFILVSILLITINVAGSMPNSLSVPETIHHAAFTVASVITTTGFSTVDFTLWPAASQAILLCLMISGACAGSTGGGIKVSRVLLLFKSIQYNIHDVLRPDEVRTIRMNGKRVDERVLRLVLSYLAVYVFIMIAGFLILSFDGANYGIETNFTAVMATLNNIGPGMGAVGPMSNYAGYHAVSKLTMCALMLLGRLEIYPIIAMVSPITRSRS